MPIHAHFFRLAILIREVGQCLVCDQGSLVGLCMSVSLSAAFTICATLVNTQTDRQPLDQLI